MWIGADASDEEIAELLGHEFGHAVRDAENNAFVAADDAELDAHQEAEEATADTYGAVAKAVVKFLRHHRNRDSEP